MKVEIGEYLRLDIGYIYKYESNDYEWIYEEEGQLVYGNGANEYEWESNIVNHSFNIIDLIQEGDYVNGKLVEWIGYKLYQDNGKECVGIGDKIILFNEFTKDSVSEKGIKSIVTKEQFSQMEYKVGE